MCIQTINQTIALGGAELVAFGCFNSRLDSKVAREIDFYKGDAVDDESLKRLILSFL